MKLNTKPLYILYLMLASCASSSHTESMKSTEALQPFNLIENKGIRGIRTDVSTEKDVIDAFGTGYIIERPDSKLCAIKYPKLGLSFWYLVTDTSKIIDRICASPLVFKGFTGDGLPVNDELNVEKVLQTYSGICYKWYLEGDGTLYLDYKDEGIVFKIPADTSLRHINRYLTEHADSLLSELYANSRVVQISIPW